MPLSAIPGPEGPIGPPGSNAWFVEHDDDAAAARPSGFDFVIWLGSVQPLNAAATDLVVRTDEAV